MPRRLACLARRPKPLLVVMAVVCAVVQVFAAVYTDDFAGAAGDLTSPWVQGRTSTGLTVQRDGAGHARSQNNLGNDALVLYSSAVGNDQYSQIQVNAWQHQGTDTDFLYFVLRATNAAHWYESANFYLFWTDGGSDSSLFYTNTSTGNSGVAVIDTMNGLTFTAADTLKLEIVGSTIKLYKNTVAQTWTTSGSDHVTDTHIASGGFPGFGFSVDSTTAYLLDNWEGGDVGGGTTCTPTMLLMGVARCG